MIKEFNSKYWYLAIIGIQILLLAYTFFYFFEHPGDNLFCSYGDGLKNYFTLQSYVSEPIGEDGIFKFNRFSYPFGDYVYYTDNTPFFSIPFRWFCQNIWDLSKYTIPFYNYFILSNILLCSLLSFAIFKKILGANIITFILANTLPWINPQIQRIYCGHYNLSITSLCVVSIILFYWWQKYNHHLIKQAIVTLGIVAFSILAFFIHGYYLAIITVFISFMLLFYSLLTIKKENSRRRMILSVIVPLAVVGLVFALLQYTDLYLSLRQEKAMGYDWDEQKTIFSRLHTHYSFHRVFFPIYAGRNEDSIELSSYLGNIGLFSFALILTGTLLSKQFRKKVFQIQKSFFKDPVKKSIFWAGLMMLFISFGEIYNTLKSPVYIGLPFINEHPFTFKKITIYILSLICLLFLGRSLVKSAAESPTKSKLYERFLALLSGALLLFLLLGEYRVTILNIFNPFLYLHSITNRVEQFRSLSRFNWPFFWSFYIWVMYTLIQLFNQSSKQLRAFIILIIGGLGIIEIYDNATFIQKRAKNDNPFAQSDIYSKIKFNPQEFQAILPLPFYMVGSEDYEFTFDDEFEFSKKTMQFSLNSGLPLMSSKMSRTPPEFSKNLIDFVAFDRLEAGLKEKLNKKPILIMAEKNLIRDTFAYFTPKVDFKQARVRYNHTLSFIERNQLTAIDSAGNILFYSYQVP